MIVIITHGDIDGLVAASILYSYLNRLSKKVRIITSQPYTLYHAIARLYTYINELERVYIIDLGLDEDVWKRIKPLVELLVKKVKIFWIDHHLTTLSLAEELANLGIALIFSIDKCASTIVFQMLSKKLDDVNFYKKLTLIGEVYDKVTECSDKNIIDLTDKLTLALSENPSDDTFKQDLIKLWVFDKKFINDEVILRASIAGKKLARLYKLAYNNLIYSSEKLMVIDFRNVNATGFIGLLASRIADETRKIVLIVFNSPTELIVTVRIPKEMDIDISQELYKIAKEYGGSGGGHPKALSLRLPLLVPEDTINELIQRIEKLLSRI